MRFFKKHKHIEFTETVRNEFLIIINKILQILDKANLTAQVQVVKALENLLKEQNDEQFVKQLNDVDMWGGSGAVWEVNIEDGRNALEFEMEMIKLIDFMEQTNVIGKGIKPIRKIFAKNLKGKEVKKT